MGYINMQGDENTIIQELSKCLNQREAKLIVQNMSLFMDDLGDDEEFDVTEEKQGQEDDAGRIKRCLNCKR